MLCVCVCVFSNKTKQLNRPHSTLAYNNACVKYTSEELQIPPDYLQSFYISEQNSDLDIFRITV